MEFTYVVGAADGAAAATGTGTGTATAGIDAASNYIVDINVYAALFQHIKTKGDSTVPPAVDSV